MRGETLTLGTISEEVRDLQQALADTAMACRSMANMTARTMEVVAAFQRHFRPARVDGIADHSTFITLHSLMSSLPPDAFGA